MCRDEDVASAKAIAKDTKPCPRCAVPIFKTEGCYQMFCVKCHCVFDWKNGKELINPRVLHNPHYVEWMRRSRGADYNDGNNDNLLGLECGHGGMAADADQDENDRHGFDVIMNGIVEWSPYDERASNLQDLWMTINHIRDVDMAQIASNRCRNEREAMRMRILLMRGRIDENYMKAELQRREKRMAFALARNEVYSMLVVAVHDLIRNLNVGWMDPSTRACHSTKHDFLVQGLDAICRLIEYFNESMNKLLASFGSQARGVLYTCRICPSTWILTTTGARN